MKTRILLFTLLLLLSTVAAVAEETQTVLSSGGVVYTVDHSARTSVRLVRRVADERDVITVPLTDDDAIESQTRLLWDDTTSTLYVLWHRSHDRSDQILLSRLDAAGNWTDPIIIATGSGSRRAGLQVVLAHAGPATLIHAAWWTINENPMAEYALIAFEKEQHVSTLVVDLKTLAGAYGSNDFETEPVTEVLHPPLAMDRSTGASVDVVFGAPDSTALTRVTIDPKVRGDARLWKPSRKGGGITPRAGLMSASGNPVKAILNEGRIVLYAAERKFRFAIYQNGQWSPERMIQLDGGLTSDQMVQELRRTLEQLEVDETPTPAVIE